MSEFLKFVDFFFELWYNKIVKTLIVRHRNQVTLPKEMLTGGVHEFEYEKLEDGTYRLIPLVAVPVSQQYFWTKRWLKGEEEADQDIQRGRFKDFDSAEDLITDLRATRSKSKHQDK